jgi:hypothetical protein
MNGITKSNNMGREKSPPPTTKGEEQSEASKTAQQKLESEWYKRQHELSRAYKKARSAAHRSLSHKTSKGGRRKHSRKSAFTKKK